MCCLGRIVVRRRLFSGYAGHPAASWVRRDFEVVIPAVQRGGNVCRQPSLTAADVPIRSAMEVLKGGGRRQRQRRRHRGRGSGGSPLDLFLVLFRLTFIGRARAGQQLVRRGPLSSSSRFVSVSSTPTCRTVETLTVAMKHLQRGANAGFCSAAHRGVRPSPGSSRRAAASAGPPSGSWAMVPCAVSTT